MIRNTSLVTVLITLFLIISFFYFTQHKLEFKSERLYENYIFYSYLLVIALIAVFVILLPNTENGKVGRLVGFILMGMVALMWFFKSLPVPYPQDLFKSDRRVLYINRKDTLTKIIEQVYFTGIAGSNEKYDTVKTKPLCKDVRWTEKIELSKIDKSEWQKR